MTDPDPGSRQTFNPDPAPPRRGYRVTTIELVGQGVFTTIVLLRLWKGWDFTLRAIGWSLATIAYMAPAAIAIRRSHPKRGAIVGINILFGWTGVGWIASLVWALRQPSPAEKPAD